MAMSIFQWLEKNDSIQVGIIFDIQIKTFNIIVLNAATREKHVSEGVEFIKANSSKIGDKWNDYKIVENDKIYDDCWRKWVA